MASHAIDSVLFRDLFGSEEIRRVFADEALVQRWLDVEAALARAEARVGLIPQEGAEEIARKARRENVDLERLGALRNAAAPRQGLNRQGQRS